MTKKPSPEVDVESYTQLFEVAHALSCRIGDLDNPHATKWEVVPGDVLNMVDDIQRIARGAPPHNDWRADPDTTGHQQHLVGNIPGCKHCCRIWRLLEREGQINLPCPARRARPIPTARKEAP